MGFLEKLLKFLSGCMGSIFIFLAIFILITFLISLSLMSNLDNINDSIQKGAYSFINENKQEIKELLTNTTDSSGISNLITGNTVRETAYTAGEERVFNNTKTETPNIGFNKADMISACQNKDAIIKENPEMSKFLTAKLCANISNKTEQQIKEDVIDAMIDSYSDLYINKTLTAMDTTKTVNEIKSKALPIIEQYTPLTLILIILFLLLGIFFTFLAASFNIGKTLYKSCLKIGVVSGIALIPFIVLFLLTPSALALFIQKFIPSDLPLAISNLLVKLVAQIALDWLKSSLLQVFVFVLISTVVFIALAIILKIYVINKDSKPTKK